MLAKGKVGILVCLLASIAALSYEDVSHQRLTDQTCEVARTRGGLDGSELLTRYRQQIIDGAGRHESRERYGLDTDGEDYTVYEIHWNCPVSVEKQAGFRGWLEPLNHFRSGLFSGRPAFAKFMAFYNDAIQLWRAGKKDEAAFILGRAVHIVEDMAQPQHAMNDLHLPWAY